MAWVYILLCDDDSYYTGSTRDLDLRNWQHSVGAGAIHTRRHPPVALVWAQEFDHVGEARAVERQIHGWSRAKKLALIEGRYGALRSLASRGRKPKN